MNSSGAQIGTQEESISDLRTQMTSRIIVIQRYSPAGVNDPAVHGDTSFFPFFLASDEVSQFGLCRREA